MRSAGNKSEANGVAWIPVGHDDQQAIRRQLDKLVSNRLFGSSKRYPQFLRYVVEESLQGRAENLKERTLGIQVFAREPDYDTNLDHIVRSTASEVRKRLRLYYHEPTHESEVFIDLPPGTYVPVFRRPEETRQAIRLDPILPRPERAGYPGWVTSLLVGALMLVIGAGIGIGIARFANLGEIVSAARPQTLIEALAPKAGQHLDVIVGDSALYFRANKGQMVSLEDYKSRRYLEPQEPISGVPVNPAFEHWLTQGNITDAYVFPLIERVFEAVPADQVSVMHPANVTDQNFEDDNALLLGGPWVDPWIQLFESRLNFRSEAHPGHGGADILNVAPRPGEQSVYSTDAEEERTYARLAYVPNLSHKGMVLIVTGPSKTGTTAAVNFATDPTALQTLFELFGANRLKDLPSFEVLLEVTTKGNAPVQSKVVAWRNEKADTR
jgi:hypothetical protein